MIVYMLPARHRNQSYIRWRLERVGMGVGWRWGWEISHYAQVKIVTELVIVEIPTMLLCFISKKKFPSGTLNKDLQCLF